MPLIPFQVMTAPSHTHSVLPGNSSQIAVKAPASAMEREEIQLAVPTSHSRTVLSLDTVTTRELRKCEGGSKAMAPVRQRFCHGMVGSLTWRRRWDNSLNKCSQRYLEHGPPKW